MAKLKLPIQRPWIPYVIFVITLTLTIIATYYISRATNREDHLRFMNAVVDTNTGISSHLETYVALLRGVAGLYSASPDLTQQQFNAYVNRLRLASNYPGALGIGLIQKVTNDNKESYVQTVQNEGAPQFRITPPGTRPEYFVIRYLTLSNNHPPMILGYDMAADSIRLQAMDKARDKGKTTTSSKILLLTINNKIKSPGFIIFTPIYQGGIVPSTIAERRNKIIGFIYSAFASKDLFKSIKLPQMVNYQIYDSKQLTNANLLFDTKSQNTQSSTNYFSRFQTTSTIMVGGEMWSIVYTNHPQFDTESQQDLSSLIFVGGVLISIMFFMLSRSQFMAQTEAETTAAKLQIAQKELQKAIAMRENFISIASHELKTPVTSMRVYTQMLQRQSSKKGDKKTSEYLTKIIKQIDKLTLLIQDLLDVSRIQSNQLPFRLATFDINEMAKEVVDSTQQIAHRHTILLKGTIGKPLWGDRERISQVLINLLTNALKYSPKANKVIVTLKETKHAVFVSVQDFGIGISKIHQKKIFDRFYRISEKKEQTYPGLGIGLFISQAIIKRHGGEITVTSGRGKGTTFRFTLPYNYNRPSKAK